MTTLATLCFILRDREVLLIRKKRGFGAGKYNGVGGKVERDENIIDAAIREVKEEVGIEPLELEYAGVLEFYTNGNEPDWVVHVFLCRKFRGEPKPSDEAEPKWFPLDSLPYDKMWVDDRLWLPHVLSGRRVSAKFWFTRNYEKMLKWEVRIEGACKKEL